MTNNDSIRDDEKNSIQSFYDAKSGAWEDLAPNLDQADDDKKEKLATMANTSKEKIREFLLTSLQMQHLVVFAGSGTSLGDAGGPSMQDLWNCCVNSNSENHGKKQGVFQNGKEVIKQIGYDQKKEGENIEALLSRCDAFQQVTPNTKVANFVNASKKAILEKCSHFIEPSNDEQLAAHRTFLHRISRRRARDSRLKLFTTNYDLCFETAAGQQGLVVLDGFSFTEPRCFDPRFFLYDIVRRPISGEEIGTPLEGVFHLYKLHGSVNWCRNDNRIEIKASPPPESAALIYPVNGKYQQSYIQPHLEIISQYLAVLREPNICLIVVGFGFNDTHLSEPILAAVRTNPHLRLIIIDPSAKKNSTNVEVWKKIFSFAKRGEDVCLINANFSAFSEMIPDLKALTPAQRLSREIQNIAGRP